MKTLLLYNTELFLLFIFPLIGLYFSKFLSHKFTKIIFIISGLILLPIIAGFKSTIPFLYYITIVLMLSVLYARKLAKIDDEEERTKPTLVLTIILFLILGLFLRVSSFLGYVKVEQKWTVENYKIELIEERGFSGGALITYNLNEFALIPIYIKKVQTTNSNDKLDNCRVPFNRREFIFNHCNETITEN